MARSKPLSAGRLCIKRHPGAPYNFSVGTSRFAPLSSKISDPIEFQCGSLAFSNDRYALPLLTRQNHRSRYCRAELHGAVVFQGNEFFGVKGHFARAGAYGQLNKPAQTPQLPGKDLIEKWLTFGSAEQALWRGHRRYAKPNRTGRSQSKQSNHLLAS
jgi:hypothetical protein